MLRSSSPRLRPHRVPRPGRLVTGVLLATGVGLLPVAGCGPASGTPQAVWSSGPSTAGSSASASEPVAPPSPSASSAAPAPTGPFSYTMPVGGRTSYASTHHDYPAADMMAACGLPVLAATSGVVLEVDRVDRYDPAHPVAAVRGGISVSLLGDDGVRYYGSHLSAVAAGIEPGVRVAVGARLGSVGRTGNASACHLHFGISPPCARTGDWWVRRGEVSPVAYLNAWRAGTMTSPATEVAEWQSRHGCPSSPPAGY